MGVRNLDVAIVSDEAGVGVHWESIVSRIVSRAVKNGAKTGQTGRFQRVSILRKSTSVQVVTNVSKQLLEINQRLVQ